MEEILEKAKKLYPIGTRFESALTNTIGIVKGEYSIASEDIYVTVERDNGQADKLFIRHNGIWAIILSSLEPSIINNYQIY